MESVRYIATVVKPSAEKRAFTVDFTDRMPTSATLSSCAVSGVKLSTAATDNTVVSSTTATIDGAGASVFIQAGTAGQKYRITFTATLSDGSILPEYVLLIIDDTPS